MAENTGIEWTEKTWNPVIGCAKVSAGCKHCYAETMATRIVAMGNKDYPAVVGPDGKWNGKGKFLPHRLAEPMKWSKPCRVFVNSMSDLFHENITNEQIAAVFGVMAATRHTYQVLTKRPERALEWFQWIAEVGEACTDPWTECHWAALLVEKLSVGDGGPIHCKGPAQSDDVARPWPLPNVWIGVSVENQEQADKRIPILLQIPASVRFLSCEPLLGPVSFNDAIYPPKRDAANREAIRKWKEDAEREGRRPRFSDFPGLNITGDMDSVEYVERMRDGRYLLDWVIVGGESGPDARSCEVQWIRDIVAQCKSAGVACFVKQLGAKASTWGSAGPFMPLKSRKGGDPEEWPEDLRVREYPEWFEERPRAEGHEEF